jgi:hypothetical protein
MEVKDDLCRRARRLSESLTKWKRRVAQNQELIRYLRVRVRDLEVSRGFWKQRATTTESVDCLLLAGSTESELTMTVSSLTVAPGSEGILGE